MTFFRIYGTILLLFALHINLQYKLIRPWPLVMESGYIRNSGSFHTHGTVDTNTDSWVFFYTFFAIQNLSVDHLAKGAGSFLFFYIPFAPNIIKCHECMV